MLRTRRTQHAAIFVVATLLVSIVVAAPAATADEGPYTYGGHEYWVLNASCLDWQAAEDHAVSLGGHLAAIYDAGEQAFVYGLIEGSGDGYWIGFTDQAVEGTWVWNNGDPTTYTNWNLHEPNNYQGIEHCGAIQVAWAGKWNDLPCHGCAGAVIEIVPPPPAPEDRLIETIAGNFNGNGFLATEVPLWPTGGMLFEPNGDILVNDYTSLYRIDATTDRVTRIAGFRSVSSSGDGGPASTASWASFGSFARDSAGNIYIPDTFFYKVRKIAPDGTITTVAGDGNFGYSGDGGPATSAEISECYGLAVNAADELFIADGLNNVIRKVDASGTISTVAGSGTCGCSGDGGPATSAVLCEPLDVDFDSAGNLYIADSGCLMIRKVDAGGTITTVAGDGFWGFFGDGGPATSAQFAYPNAITFDSVDNLYIADHYNHRIRLVDESGTITTVAGDGSGGFSGDGGPATDASLSEVFGLAVDNADRLVIADTVQNRRLRRIENGVIDTIAGRGDNFFGDGQAAIAAALSPRGLAFDAAGDLIVADASNYRLRKIDATGIISTIAGTGQRGSGGDGGPATAAEFNRPVDIATASDGSIYVVDRANHKIRKIDATTGDITTVAGNGTSGYSGNGGPATAAQLNFPRSIALGPDGTYYIADEFNDRIRRVTPAGTIDTYAGDGNRDFYGDGGPATNAAFNRPRGLALDAVGNLYIADTFNQRVRRVDTNGIVTTFLSGLVFPDQLSSHPDGDLIITSETQVIKSDLQGNHEVIAGSGTYGFSGDGGPAVAALLSSTYAAIADADDSIYISDAGNTRIRKVFTYTEDPPSVPLPTVSETATGLSAGSATGSSVAGAGDVNGDGLDDFIAGAPGFQDDGGPLEAGAAAVYLGSAVEADRATPDIIFIGEQAHDRAGVSVEGDFDFNGDGVNDFLIGAEQVDRTNPSNPVPLGPGKVYLVYFDPTDLGHYPNLENPVLEDRVDLALVGQPGGIPGAVFVGAMTGDRAGFAVAAGEGVGAGGGTEIAIGAPGRDTPGGADAGTVYLIFNDPALSARIDLSGVANGHDEIAGVVYEGGAAGDGLGSSVVFPGDVDEAPGTDLAIGAPFADPAPPPGAEASRTDAGLVYLVSGGSVLTSIIEVDQIGTGGKSSLAGTQIMGTQAAEHLGSALAGGGDALVNGQADLLIGAPGYDSGTSVDAGRVIQSAGPLPLGIIEVDQIGNTGGSTIAIHGVQYIGENDGDALGTAVAGVGDVTGDLIDDVALGAPLADPDGLADAGIIYVVSGQEYTANAIIEVDQIGGTVSGRQVTGTQVGEMAGSGLDVAGDLNGDGTHDFIASSPGADLPGQADSGSVSMVLETTDLAAGEPPPLGAPPVADAGEDQFLECQADLSAPTVLDGSGSTDPDDDIVSYEWSENGLPIASDVAPAVTFSLGAHEVSLTLTDSTNLSDSDDVTITVADTTAPSIACPADVTVECTNDLQAPVALAAATASDGCGSAVSISNSHTEGGADASGSYPLGTTIVVFTAVDDAGNTASCSTVVTVGDTIPPVVTAVAEPDLLWPPNHRPTEVHYDVAVVEACDPNPWIQLDSITSNEPDDAVGDADGATTPDIQDATLGAADFDVLLRAERNGNGPGRVYTAVYSAADAAGNVGQGLATTVVPHDQGGGVVEPITLRLVGSARTTAVWGAVSGATEYHVIRGDLDALRSVGSDYVLGALTCVERVSLGIGETADENGMTPESGRSFFYLVQSVGSAGPSGYGTASASKHRRPGPGDCRW